MATTDKYDRQVRLWGSHGQKILAHGEVILLGISSAGTETLKNLVLPGIGKFTVVDDSLVTLRDCGNDFFVTQEDIGKPRAEVVKTLLEELNSDSKGKAICQPINDFISQNSYLIDNASLVVACDLNNKQAICLGNMVELSNTPLILLRSYGSLGYMRIYKRESCIMEGKEYGVNTRDLRVATPWPELL